jgi:DNA topoisomerase VI B subunit
MGTIAEFMRKRTQLVGFEFGYWKHTQYLTEFLDNALDAIESFQWNELKKPDSNIKFTLNQEITLENLSVLQTVKEEKKRFLPMNEEAKHTLMQEFGLEPSDSEESEIIVSEDKEVKSEIITDESKIEVEEEVKNIIYNMEEIINLVESIVDVEPIVIVRLSESEAASYLTSELSQKNIMSYTFEIFDNGTGMTKVDLRKFGKYLASSKSMELKQTRGSQGFGAPSAFSDAQNTTGKPIVVVSRSAANVYATVSEFFTTSKNEKKYIIHPTDIDCPFLHGTYIKLHYLNVKYVRGYVDTYINESALMNPHVTLIFIDPYNKEHIYPRKVSTFPMQPKYAKSHPSSTNIGDLQDLLAKTENLTISSFLKENFVRISSKTAKQILTLAESDLQDKLNIFILKNGFLTIAQKQSDNINYLRFEKRIFGKAQKERDKLIIYKLGSDEIKNVYWDLITKYNQFNKDHEQINKQIKRYNNRIEKVETKKEEKSIEKEIKKCLNIINDIRKKKEKIKLELDNLFNKTSNSLIELKKFKNRSDYEDLIIEVRLSKAKPSEITKDQFNSLFLAFKSIKYMAPPTDTAIPIGAFVLENTLIKDIGLKISENLDVFDTPVDNFNTIKDLLKEEKKNALVQEDLSVDDEILNNISVDTEEIIDLSSQILVSIDIKDDTLEFDQFKHSLTNIIAYSEVELKDTYEDLFEYFFVNYTKDDDFIAAETRDPTSGKGLAYVVEAVLAYSNLIEVPKRSRDVLSRFVNRTPKLRDSADCAITKAVQSVNWKNYKLDTYDNNLPKGPIKLLVNVSGPFVHLMFKSQSKNALADDEDLIKEIKYCLETIGRKLRIYLNRKATIYKSEKRTSLIEKYIPKFVKSLYNIASQGESIYKAKLNEEELVNLMRDAIGKKTPPVIVQKIVPEKLEIKKEEVTVEEPPKKEVVVAKIAPEKVVISVKTLQNWTINELRDYCNEYNIKISTKIRKIDIINKIQESFEKERIVEMPKIEKPVKPVKFEPLLPGTIKVAKARLQITKGQVSSKPPTIKIPIKPKSKVLPPKPIQTHLPVITSGSIMASLSDEWQTIKHLIFKLKIKDMMDARFLQIKLKELERKGQILVDIKTGKKYWKRK